MLQVLRMKIKCCSTQKACSLNSRSATLQHIVDLKPLVVDLSEPLHGHVRREEASIAPGLCEIVNHVLHKRAAQIVIVFRRGLLVQKLVVQTSAALSIEDAPLLHQLGLRLGVVLLALWILHGAVYVVVVELVLFNKGLPVLVAIQPLRLRDEGDGGVLKRNPECARSILHDGLRLLHGLLAALDSLVKELPACRLRCHAGSLVLREHRIEELRLLCVEVLQALEDFLVADASLPRCPIDGWHWLTCGRDQG
mmetsp:Transcript_130978/g.231479  ORF Transcript_130978/g.231479 Transcript_130978/m.231479 type:complete len:252 (+) Transcript_130978:864-1619(+)